MSQSIISIKSRITNRSTLVFRHAQEVFVKFNGQIVYAQFLIIHERVEIRHRLILKRVEQIARVGNHLYVVVHAVHQQYQTDLNNNNNTIQSTYFLLFYFFQV